MVQITVFGRTFKNRTIWQIVIASVFLLFLAIIIPTLAVLNNAIGLQKQTNYYYGKFNPAVVKDSWDGVVIWANISTISSQGFTLNTKFSIYPAGKYSSYLGQGIYVFKNPVSLRSGAKVIKFDNNDLLRAGDYDYPIIEGDPNQYPFDKYYSELIIGMKDEKGEPIPIAFGIVGNVQGWLVDADVVDLNDSETLQVRVYAKRSFIIKFFSMFVLFTMWTLSLTILTLSATIWFRDRKVEPPTIGLCASLIFALPAIRNTQPDSPPIGCTVDVAGFFFNMAIVAFATFLAMLNYIVKYRRVKPPTLPAPVAASLDKEDQGTTITLPSSDVSETTTLLDRKE